MKALATKDVDGARAALVDSEAAADATLPDGTTALHAAAIGGDPACVDLVLNAALDPRRPARIRSVPRRASRSRRASRGGRGAGPPSWRPWPRTE